MSVLTQTGFDAEAFGMPFWRVGHDLCGLEEELAGVLAPPGPVAVDAKRPAEDREGAFRLQEAGFRRVCTQVRFRAGAAAPVDEGVRVDRSLELGPADIDLHARNFRYDRFSLDPRLPEQGRVALYRAWITNSLVRYEAAWAGRDFCTFKEDGRELVIDLVSVLVAGQGIGGRLVRAVRSAAGLRGLEGVRVVTEVENRSAWRLYSREGFAVDGYVHVFHLVRS